MEKVNLNVEGMSCEHCSNAIKGALLRVDGIKEVSVNLSDKIVSVCFENVDLNTIKDTIEEQGFEVI